MPLGLGDPIQDEPGSIYDYASSAGQSAYAAGRRAYDSSGFVYGLYNAARSAVDYEWGTRVSKQDALKRVGEVGLSIDVPDDGMSKYKLDTLIWYKSREQADQLYMQRSPGGFGRGVAEFGAGVLGSLGDPVSLAANFIPFVPEARYANALRSAGTSTLARAGVRAKYGAIEGALGALAVEPTMMAHNRWSQLDYGVADSFMNVVFGTVAGAGLHSLGGYAFDKFKIPTPRIRDLVGSMDEKDMLSVLKEFVKAAELGRRDPDALEMMMRQFAEGHAQWRSESASTDVELIQHGLGFSDADLKAAHSDIELAAFPPEHQYAGQNLFTHIALNGGIKVRDAAGNITKDGHEILALVGDAKYPGLINNVHGNPPDYVREMLHEDGWFGAGRDPGSTDLNDLYDILDAQARGDVRHPDNIAAQASNKAQDRYVANVKRELDEAGIQAHESPVAKSQKLAAYRAEKMRERAAKDPDFDPEEALWRDPSEPMGAGEESSRFADDDGSQPYSFIDEENEKARQAAEDEVAAYSSQTDEEVALQDELSSLDAVVNSLKARDMWTAAEDDLLAAAKEDKVLAEHLEQVYRAAAACEFQ
jgi:hypothetical protein